MIAPRLAGVALGVALLSLRCGPAGDDLAPPRSPGEAALRSFALAHATDLDLEAVQAVLDDSAVESDRTAAFEAIEALGQAHDPRVDAVVPLPGLDRSAVDVTADLKGGGSAQYSFQVAERSDASWRIVAINAPGVEWPRPSGKGAGLSVSAPAGELLRSR
jgi:hypothetical protein